MNSDAIQNRLKQAQQRKASAESHEHSFTREINYHDQRASEIRKERQKARSKKDRADASIKKLSALLRSAP